MVLLSSGGYTDAPEHGSQQMAFRIAEPSTLLEYLAGSAGNDIRANIPGMRNGIAHPLKEGTGFLRVVRERVREDLRLLDDSRGLPVDKGVHLR